MFQYFFRKSTLIFFLCLTLPVTSFAAGGLDTLARIALLQLQTSIVENVGPVDYNTSQAKLNEIVKQEVRNKMKFRLQYDAVKNPHYVSIFTNVVVDLRYKTEKQVRKIASILNGLATFNVQFNEQGQQLIDLSQRVALALHLEAKRLPQEIAKVAKAHEAFLEASPETKMQRREDLFFAFTESYQHQTRILDAVSDPREHESLDRPYRHSWE